MYVASDEVRLFSRLGYEDLGYESESEFNAYIGTLIPLAEGLVDQFCSVPKGFFQAAGYEESSGLYDYRETWIHLRYHPVLSVSKVEVNTASYGSGANWIELASTEYIVANDRGLLKIVGAHKPAEMLQSIRVTYTAGYSETPEIIRYVVLNICSNIMHAMLQRKINPVMRVDDFTVRMIIPHAFTRELQAALAPYVHQQVFVG
jgi:hypothetical protein